MSLKERCSICPAWYDQPALSFFNMRNKMQVDALFTCPQCGSHKLDEVMIGVIQTTDITAVERTSEGLACDYGDCTLDGGTVAHYQCGQCGHEIASDEDELAEILFGKDTEG
jgi:DNA-directed RNA polymerase subunit RPC12/RpoP